MKREFWLRETAGMGMVRIRIKTGFTEDRWTRKRKIPPHTGSA